MLSNQFFSFFVLTISVIVALVATAAIIFIVVRTWRCLVMYLKKYWGICIGVLIAYALSFAVFVSIDMPLRSILGIVIAGVLISTFCVPFMGYHYRSLGMNRVIGISLLTIIGGICISVLSVAVLIAAVSN